MAHSSPHKVIFHCCSNEKENSKGNIYQVGCALAEPVAQNKHRAQCAATAPGSS